MNDDFRIEIIKHRAPKRTNKNLNIRWVCPNCKKTKISYGDILGYNYGSKYCDECETELEKERFAKQFKLKERGIDYI